MLEPRRCAACPSLSWTAAVLTPPRAAEPSAGPTSRRPRVARARPSLRTHPQAPPSLRRRRAPPDPHPSLDLTALDERGGVEDDGPPEGDRWSTWDGAEHGPRPRPGWVITDHAAVDTDLGVLKTGKEADVHLVERAVPGTDRRALMAAKRYRTAQHRMFHRDAGYLEGRRVRRSREMRAMATPHGVRPRPAVGQWASAEFGALTRLWQAGVPVPYPVQLAGTELLLEYLGTDDGQAAPRLAQLRPDPDELADLWAQLVDALLGLARARAGPRRPVGVQPPRPRRAAGGDRPAAGRRRGGQPERAGVPRP